MPETACLHIQARESDPIRVVELPGTSVRIGRASYCEVRLAEPELAEEECRLKRRGGSWQLVPARGSVYVSIDGRSVAEACPLPFDVPFRVGEHWLTLRPTATSVQGWSDYQAPRPSTSVPVREDFRPAAYREPVAPPEPPRPVLSTAPPPSAAGTAMPIDTPDHVAQWKERHEQRVGRLKAGQGEKRWEERWRAAGERLRARAAASAPPLSSERSVPPVAPDPAPLGRTPFSDAERRQRTDRAVDRAEPPAVAPAAAPPARALLMLAPPVVPDAWASDNGVGDAHPVVIDAPAPSYTVADAHVEPAVEIAEVPPPALLVDSLPGDAQSVTIAADVPEVEPEADRVDQQPAAVRTADPTDPELGTHEKTALDPDPADTEEPSSAPAIEEPQSRGLTVLEPAENAAQPTESDHVESGGRPGFFARTRFLWSSATRELRVQSTPDRTVPAPEPPIVDAPSELDRTSSRRSANDVDETPESTPGPARKPPRPMPAAPSTAARGRPVTAPRNALGAARATDRRRSRPAESTAADSAREWPSASDILAAHRLEAARAASPRPAPRTVQEPIPTEPREPGHWRVSPWVAFPPALAVTLVAGALAVGLAWNWSIDAQSTGVVAGLLAQRGDVKPLPEKLAQPGASWWKSSASHLVQWALYFDRLGSSDPAAVERANELLDTAARSSPLHAQVRFALARRAPAEGASSETLFASLGLSRDVEALAWSGRQWQRAGKPGPALKAYRAALEMATRAEPARLPLPSFDDEPRVQRYHLPGEALVALVVREMAKQEGWTFAEWSEALPPSALVWLSTARVLRELGSPDAEKALDSLLASLNSPAPADCSVAIHRAAQAEALALKERWKEAEARYHEAIDLETHDAIRRSWWMNLAEIDQKLFDEPARQKALEAAKGDDANDEIAQRAIDLLKYTGIQGEKSRASR